MKAVILAGGRGSRLNEFTKDKNKCMIELFEKPLIEYNLDHAVEANVSEIIIVIAYKPEEIIKKYGNKYKDIKIRYIKSVNNESELEKKGLVDGISVTKELIGNSDFILMLGDEIAVDPDIKGMIRKFKKTNSLAVCGIVHEEDRYSIGKTYTAMINENERVFRLIEKPKVKINNIKGTGHCILRNEIFDYIERTPINAIRGQKELVDLIQVAIDDGKKVHVYPITKHYTNINTKEDYNLAKEMIRENNPKILIIHNQMKYYGGAELLIVELSNWLTKLGVSNDILTLSKSKEVENSLINTNIITIDKYNKINLRPPGYRGMNEILMAIWMFRKKLKKIEKNYDVINFHDFPVTWTLFPRRKPSVWFMNLPPNLWSKPEADILIKTINKIRIAIDRYIIRNSIDKIIVAEEINKFRSEQRYNKKAKLIHIGIDHEFFSNSNKDNAIKNFNLKNKFIIIHSGMLTHVKNQLESLKIINRIKDKIPNLLLILTGRSDDLEYKKKIDEYIKKNNLEKFVMFIGMFNSRNDLRDLYASADVGLFPVGEQGGILAPLEMLSAGIPTIVSEDIETASFMKEKNLGIVTKDYDKIILDIYNNKIKYNQEAYESSLFIKNNLSWKLFTESMLREFKLAWKKHKIIKP